MFSIYCIGSSWNFFSNVIKIAWKMQGTHETRVVSRYTHEAILYIDITDVY